MNFMILNPVPVDLTANSATHILDSRVLRSLFQTLQGNPPEFWTEFIELYSEHSLECLEMLYLAIQTKNLPRLYMATSLLEAMGKTFGARTLVQYCDALERKSHPHVLEDVAEQVCQIQLECAKVDAALRSEYQRLSQEIYPHSTPPYF